MGDVGFRGTSSEQDGRFSDKEKKLLKQMKFEDVLEKKVWGLFYFFLKSNPINPV